MLTDDFFPSSSSFFSLILVSIDTRALINRVPWIKIPFVFLPSASVRRGTSAAGTPRRIPAFQSNFPSPPLPPIGIKCITSDRERKGESGRERREEKKKHTHGGEKREEGCRGKGGEEERFVTGVLAQQSRGKSENITSEKPWCSRAWGPVRRSGATIGRWCTPWRERGRAYVVLKRVGAAACTHLG